MLSDTMMLGGGRKAAYPIENSLLFRGGSYLARLPAAAGHADKWCYNVWVRRATLGARQVLFLASADGGNLTNIFFDSSDRLVVQHDVSWAVQWSIVTAAVFRDPTAWMNVHVAADTSLSTASDRVQIFINGVKVTAFADSPTYPGSGSNTFVNQACPHFIGFIGGAAYFNGYMAEPVLVDGAALPPTSFGEFDPVTLNWRPKAPGVPAWGTNGFHLGKPWNAADLGHDYSGHGNDWTPSGFVATDVVADTPANVHATLNPLDTSGTLTFSSGNLKVNGPSGVYAYGRATFPLPTIGKWGFEVTTTAVDGTNTEGHIGLTQEAVGTLFSLGANVYAALSANNVRLNGVDQASAIGTSGGATIEFLFDADNLHVIVKVGGVTVATVTGMTAGQYFIGAKAFGTGTGLTYDFGQWGYTPSEAGYKTLCTANLPAPSAAARQPWKYYSCQTVTHNGTASTVTLGWNPDPANGGSHTLFRVKSLSSGSWYWIDTVRGLSKYLNSNSTAAEGTNATLIPSAASTGAVTLGSGFTAATYLVEAWRVAPEAGFDIVAYSGDGGSGTRTVSHNNGSTPKYVIAKCRSAVTDWPAYHSSLSSTNYYMLLSGTAAQANYGSIFISPNAANLTIAATSSLLNTSGQTYVAYVWSEVPGFSMFGSHVANGSTNGPLDYLGFVPGDYTTKAVSITNRSWQHHTMANSGGNPVKNYLQLDASAGDSGDTGVELLDMLSSTVKIRVGTWADYNTSGTYITTAFAARCLGGKGVPPATAR
jgi:hypothetical protein